MDGCRVDFADGEFLDFTEFDGQATINNCHLEGATTYVAQETQTDPVVWLDQQIEEVCVLAR